MFNILNIEDIIQQENLLPIKNPAIDMKAEELLKSNDSLFSEYIFGKRFTESWYIRMAYIHLNTYMPKFPIFQILRNVNLLKQFKNKSDSHYINLDTLTLTEKPGSNTLSFSQLISKNGWLALINAMAKSGEAKYQQLLNNYLNKYKAEDLITDKVLVIPPGFRDFRESDGRVSHNEISNIYSKLIKAAISFDKTNQTAVTLYIMYEKLLDGLIAKFSGKEGLLRQIFASKILNTSTRSVIVPNDNLGLDEIGIPFKALIAMYAAEICYTVLDKYKDEWLKLTSTAKESKLGATVNDILKILKKISKGYELPEFVLNFFRKILEEEILPNAVVIYKRDPALHKSSFLSARPKIAQSDAIEINTAVCAPLGGDFDGDSVYGNINIKVKKKSTGEVKTWLNQDIALVPSMLFI